MDFQKLAAPFAFVVLFHILIGAKPAWAADDSARLEGDWNCTAQINGQSMQFQMVNSANHAKIYVVMPTGNVLMREAEFTAVDGAYKEDNAKLAPAVSCDYKFINDDTLVMTSSIGTFTWHRAKAARPVDVRSKNAPPAAKPSKSPEVAVTPARSKKSTSRSQSPPASGPSIEQPAPVSPAPVGDGVDAITVPIGTVLYAAYDRNVMSNEVKPDKLLPAKISQPLVIDGKTAIPSDAVLYFRINAEPAEANGDPVYAFVADHLRVRGNNIPIKAKGKVRPPAPFVIQGGQQIMQTVSEAFNVPLHESATPDTAQDEKAPWSSPGELADCVLAGGQLVNVATQTVLADHWTFRPRAVLGRPDLVFNDETHALLQIAFPQKQLGTTPTGPMQWLNPDHRSVVMIENGDICRGEFDWLHNAVINKKPLTSKGIFERCTLIVWHDNLVYLGTSISREKPVIKMDLVSGQFTQLPPDGITAGAATPDGRLILSSIAGHIMLYNTVSGQTGTMPSTLAVRGVAGQTVQQEMFGLLAAPTDRRGDERTPSPWVADETAIAMFSSTPRDTAVLGLADFSRGASRVVALIPGQALIKQVLPGKQFVDVQVTRGAKDAPMQIHRVLFSLADGKQTVLPFPGDNGFWVDDHRFVYGVSQGDLDKLGIYVYSRTDGKTTQIAQRPAALYQSPSSTAGNATLYLPHCDTIVFNAAIPSRPLCTVKLDGSGMKQLTGQEASAIDPDPIDLGLGDSPKALWQPVAHSDAEGSAPTASTNDPNQPGDELTVKAATKNLPETDQKLAMNYYQNAIHSAPIQAFYDPAKVALKCLAVSRTAVDKEFNPILLKLDLSDCVFRPSVERYATTTVYEVVKLKQYTEQQKAQIIKAAAQEFTNKFMANPNLVKNNPSDLIQQCYNHAVDAQKH